MRVRIEKEDIGTVLFAVISFFSCFNNVYIAGFIPFFSTARGLLRLVLCLLCLTVVFFRRGRVSRFFVLYLLFLASLLLSGFVHAAEWRGMINTYSLPATVCCTLELFRTREKNLGLLLRTWGVLLFAAVAVDLLTEIAFPGGLYATEIYTTNWFLGYKTERIACSLPLVVIATYFAKKEKGRLTVGTFIVYALVLVSSALSRGTGITAMYLIVMVVFILFDRPLQRNSLRAMKAAAVLLNYKLLLLLYAVITAAVLFIENSAVVSRIAALFRKGAGISGRSTIWLRLVERFLRSPLLGLGYLTREQYREIGGFYAASNAHNAILTVLVSGGVLALAAYVAIHVYALKRYDNSVVFFMTVIIYAVLLLGVVSSIPVFAAYSFLPIFLIARERINKEHAEIAEGHGAD